MNRSVDRVIERWAKKLLLVIDGEVRKLTPEEVRVAVHGYKPKRESAKRRARSASQSPKRHK